MTGSCTCLSRVSTETSLTETVQEVNGCTRSSPLCALSISLAFSLGRKPVEAQTVHFRFPRPRAPRRRLANAAPRPAPIGRARFRDTSECPFSRQRRRRAADPTRGYWSISLSEKPAKWDLVCARGGVAGSPPGTSRETRELTGKLPREGNPLSVCPASKENKAEYLLIGASLSKLCSSSRGVPSHFLSPEWLHYAPDMFPSSAAAWNELGLKITLGLVLDWNYIKESRYFLVSLFWYLLSLPFLPLSPLW